MKKKLWIENDFLKISTCAKGAEILDIIDKKSERNFLWSGDAIFWSGQSPVLFPIIGRVWEDKIRVDGKEYHAGKHGFAKDTVFNVISHKREEIWFELLSDEKTLQTFPYIFAFRVGYRLCDKSVEVLWEVSNKGNSDMSFHIGGHPAIIWEGDLTKYVKGYIEFDTNAELVSLQANDKGFIVNGAEHSVTTKYGILEVDDETLNGDTLLFGDNQTKEITLLNQNKKPFFRMKYDSPVLAIWSPNKKDCPFVCLEPWYGLCDAVGYTGEFKDRKYTNTIKAGETFKASYLMEILN